MLQHSFWWLHVSICTEVKIYQNVHWDRFWSIDPSTYRQLSRTVENFLLGFLVIKEIKFPDQLGLKLKIDTPYLNLKRNSVTEYHFKCLQEKTQILTEAVKVSIKLKTCQVKFLSHFLNKTKIPESIKEFLNKVKSNTSANVKAYICQCDRRLTVQSKSANITFVSILGPVQTS